MSQTRANRYRFKHREFKNYKIGDTDQCPQDNANQKTHPLETKLCKPTLDWPGDSETLWMPETEKSTEFRPLHNLVETPHLTSERKRISRTSRTMFFLHDIENIESACPRGGGGGGLLIR